MPKTETPDLSDLRPSRSARHLVIAVVALLVLNIAVAFASLAVL